MGAELWISYVLRLAAGILAIQAHYAPVDGDRATRYAIAAAYYGYASGEDPYELVAVARNESDFVENLTGPDGKDCGLTQTRITGSRYSCSQLRHSYLLAFQEAARELSEYRRSCRYARDFDRCRINRYNSGYRYARTGEHGNYYLRILCFAQAAREGVDAGYACRKVTDLNQIARVLDRHRTRPVALLEPSGKRG